MIDVVADMGPAFLGTRLKRLGERMQAGAAQVIADSGLPLQPGHMGIMAALRTGPRTVGQIAESIGASQPGVSRTLAQLARLGVVEDAATEDQRSRLVKLTAQGDAMAATIAGDIWPRVGSAAEQILSQIEGDFMRQLATMERLLAEASIAERAAAAPLPNLRIREFDDSIAHEFHDINAVWIEEMFRMEPTDREVLENPRAKIVDPGGAILFVEAPGLGIVGACALQKTGPGAFELTKMGVRESARGLKAGEFLLAAMIERARELGAEKLYLLTNRKCAAAIHLYEKLGFQHDEAIMRDYGVRYERCNVAMRYVAHKNAA